jgi:hypothetical protein
MFQIFMGNPSTSEGLSLEEAISTRTFTFVKCVEKLDIHVSLLRDELHGPLDLRDVSWCGMVSGSRAIGLAEYTHICDHLNNLSWLEKGREAIRGSREF